MAAPRDSNPFPGGQAKWQVSQNQAATSRWQADGTELYLAEIGTNKIVSVSVSETDGGLPFGKPQRLIDFIAFQQTCGVYDISPNGKRILATSASHHLGAPISVDSELDPGAEEMSVTVKQPRLS